MQQQQQLVRYLRPRQPLPASCRSWCWGLVRGWRGLSTQSRAGQVSYPSQRSKAAAAAADTKGGERPKGSTGQDLSLAKSLVQNELGSLTDRILALLQTPHASLQSTAQYYFDQRGKNFRPLVILLMAKACSLIPPVQRTRPSSHESHELHESQQPTSAAPPHSLFASSSRVLALHSSKALSLLLSPLQAAFTGASSGLASALHLSSTAPEATTAAANASEQDAGFILDSQCQIAMIAEMIHTASLVHDDVIDEASTRRNKPSVNAEFGDLPSIHAGDYILAKASIQLARLGNSDVIFLLSKVLDELVRGELLQLRADSDLQERFNNYILKTYMKTASLLARSCQAVAVLGGHSAHIQQLAFQFGSHAGIAFQLVDDVLDFVSSSEVMGKPTAADLKLGLATAPVLFASQQFPELNPLILRRFGEAQDVEKAWTLVSKSNGIARSRDLAKQYCDSANAMLMQLPSSPARTALFGITDLILSRKT